MTKIINFTITPIWAAVNQIKKKIHNELGDTVNDELIEASITCSTELLKNAVEYGESVPNMQYFQFNLKYDESSILISVSNGVVKQDSFDRLRRIIDGINAGEDTNRLYADHGNEPRGQLIRQNALPGLLRIIDETDFKLAYTVQQSALTINATCKTN